MDFVTIQREMIITRIMTGDAMRAMRDVDMAAAAGDDLFTADPEQMIRDTVEIFMIMNASLQETATRMLDAQSH